jgi:uncharacterized membrane protein (DUF2068 family)
LRSSRPSGPSGFRIIGVMKLVSGLAGAAAGLGMFRLVNKDLGEVVERFLIRLHLDPDNRLAQVVLSQVARLDGRYVKAIAAGAFFYAILHFVEGVGLFLGKRWAGYLTVIATGSLLPLEIFEIARKPSAVRIAVLLVNLAILDYVAVTLRQEQRSKAGGGVLSNFTR